LPFAFRSLRIPRVLTERQLNILGYLRSYIAEHGFAPTLEEIGRHFSLRSLATVHKHLSQIEAKGFIRRLSHQSRAIEVVDPQSGPRAVRVALRGVVAAGAPIESVEMQESVALPEDFLGRGETFALRVRGDSMIGEGILDGDVIAVEAGRTPRNGAIVVATVRGEATVKKYFLEGAAVRLEPANERVAAIVAPAGDVEVKGVVVGVLRRYR
jgi:repressor LexA